MAKVREIALNYGGITRKSRAFSRVITAVNAHITPKNRVNRREVEFAAIYTSKVLTIDTREIAREHARTRGLHASFVRAFELTGANYFYARSREITPPHVTARAATRERASYRASRVITRTFAPGYIHIHVHTRLHVYICTYQSLLSIHVHEHINAYED